MVSRIPGSIMNYTVYMDSLLKEWDDFASTIFYRPIHLPKQCFLKVDNAKLKVSQQYSNQWCECTVLIHSFGIVSMYTSKSKRCRPILEANKLWYDSLIDMNGSILHGLIYSSKKLWTTSCQIWRSFLNGKRRKFKNKKIWSKSISTIIRD